MSVYEYLVNAYNYPFSNLNILECGSSSFGEETESFRMNNNCYYIEANLSDYDNMLKQSNVIKTNIFNMALYNHNGRTKFTVTSHGGNSSIQHSDSHKEELLSYGSTFHDTEVECMTYPHFIRNVIKTPIDVLVLDVEGGECEILKTMKELVPSEYPKIFVIEAGYDWAERKTLLLDLGYTIDFYQFNNVYLTHSSFNVNKNENFIRKINNENRQFIYHNKLIFVNDQV